MAVPEALSGEDLGDRKMASEEALDVLVAREWQSEVRYPQEEGEREQPQRRGQSAEGACREQPCRRGETEADGEAARAGDAVEGAGDRGGLRLAAQGNGIHGAEAAGVVGADGGGDSLGDGLAVLGAPRRSGGLVRDAEAGCLADAG